MPQTVIDFKHAAGLHCRPSALFSKIAGKYDAKATITFNGQSADMGSILDIMSLGITPGIVFIETTGNQAGELLEDIERAFASNFDEFD